MRNIYSSNGVLYYYGNPAGCLMQGKAVVDPLFYKDDLRQYLEEKEGLTVEVREGIYDRLMKGGDAGEEGIPETGRQVRIYQLSQDSPLMMRYISLTEREKRGFGTPQRSEYRLAYEGEVDGFDLEAVWEKFGNRVPKGFAGHALSISDIVEFTDGNASRRFYVEPRGFAEINF